MKVQTLEILFDDASENPRAVYRSGQTVALRVHLVLREPVKCRAIYVKLFGNSYVHWTERKQSGKSSYTKHYSSEEIYIEQKVPVFTPSGTGPNAEHHPAGEYYYPLTFQIPPTAPNSFEGDVGRIRYYVKASIDRPWKCVFHATSKSRSTTRVASSVELPGVAKGASIYLDHLLPVNPMPSSHIEGCNNIEMFYYFRVNADGGCCLSMKEECCELLIGTVPLWSSMPWGQGPGYGYDGPMMAITSQPPAPAVPPPPTYEECMFGRVNMDPEEGAGKNVNGTSQPGGAWHVSLVLGDPQRVDAAVAVGAALLQVEAGASALVVQLGGAAAGGAHDALRKKIVIGLSFHVGLLLEALASGVGNSPRHLDEVGQRIHAKPDTKVVPVLRDGCRRRF
uniref:Arrestin_N domain-containing protein n=1 Tax=Macrostomum lignano TaxID=282301 RepID=A0A1I8IU44_9PLAT